MEIKRHHYRAVPRKNKINLDLVRAALDTKCPKCGYAIPPSRIQGMNFEEMICPECGEQFKPIPPAHTTLPSH